MKNERRKRGLEQLEEDQNMLFTRLITSLNVSEQDEKIVDNIELEQTKERMTQI